MRVRDPNLLDAVESYGNQLFTGSLYRVVRHGRDPLLGGRSRGRWDAGMYDVLYTSLDRDGAIAEMEFQIRNQPVPPNRLIMELYRIPASLTRVFRVESVSGLSTFGIDPHRYNETYYEAAQLLGDAVAFLNYDALIAPNARWDCLNATIIIENLDEGSLGVAEFIEVVDFSAWREEHPRHLR